MARFFIKNRRSEPKWKRYLPLHLIALSLCLTILLITSIEKFLLGGWLTFLITGIVVGLCFLTRRHYNKVRGGVRELDELLDLPVDGPVNREPLDPKKRTAIQLVNGYNGFGVHTFLSIIREFPGLYKQFVFVSVAEVDVGSFKGSDAVTDLEAAARSAMDRYVDLARRLGFPAESRYDLGTDIVQTASGLIETVNKSYPTSMVFAGQSVFRQAGMIHRLLHNETGFAIQQELRWKGIPAVILPVRINI
jgi:K+ transporter